MWPKRDLDEHFDLRVQPAERRPRGMWESCGDVIERRSGKAFGRVYGIGSTSVAAEEDVHLEANRWLRANSAKKMRFSGPPGGEPSS